MKDDEIGDSWWLHMTTKKSIESKPNPNGHF
jgi:hypothetical protein